MDGFIASNVPVGKEYLLEKPVATPSVDVSGDSDGGFSRLLSAIIKRESGGNPAAVSPQGATGKAQIMPGTFQQYAQPGESYGNEDHRVAAATRKLADDFKFYGGDLAKTAAAYLGGRGAVTADGTIRDDVKDALGTTPRAYAEQVLKIMGVTPPANPAAPAEQTRAKKPPTWAEVVKLPEMQRLDADRLEAARNQYFMDVVAPLINEPEQMRAARAAFDKDTAPSTVGRAIHQISDTVKAVKKDIFGGSVMDDMDGQQAPLKRPQDTVAPLQWANSAEFEKVRQAYIAMPAEDREKIIAGIDPAKATIQQHAFLAIDKENKQRLGATQPGQPVPKDVFEQATDIGAKPEPKLEEIFTANRRAREREQKAFNDTMPERIDRYVAQGFGKSEAVLMATADNYDRTDRTKKDESKPWWGSDVKNSLKMGLAGMGLDTHELLRRSLGEKLITSLDAVYEGVYGKPPETLLKSMTRVAQSELTPEAAAALKKEWWDDKTDNFGAAWSDPRSYIYQFTQSIPATALTMAPSLGIAASLYKVQLAAGVAAKTAAARAATAAYIAGGLTEGLQQAGQSSREVRERILDMDKQALRGSAAMKALMDGGMTFEQARAHLAEDASGQAAVLAGVATGIFGGVGDRVLAKAFTRGLSGNIATRVMKGVASESGEEFAQGYLSKAGENVAMQRADPTIPTTQGALNEALGGAVVGGMMGGGMAVASRRAPDEAQPVPVPATGTTANRSGAVSAEDLLGKPDEVITPPAAPGAVTEPSGKILEVGRAYGGVMGREKGEGDIFASPDTVKTENAPAFVEGRETRFSTERGAELTGKFALAEAPDLTVSHDINFEKNPNFPQELQPRERERAGYAAQVESIVNRLNPERLGDNPLASDGAPIVGADGVVESGNGRMIALNKAYNRNGEAADKYRAWLADNADKFGLTPEAVKGMKQPVLVRVRATPVNRAEFARQANMSSTAALSPLELARSDANRLGSIDDFTAGEGGEFNSNSNDRFVKRFIATLPASEQTGLVDARGRLSQAGYTRIRNAVLARAYGDSHTLMRLVESVDDSSRNITKALLQSAPRIAKLREDVKDGALHDLDITPDLIAAVEELTRLREQGKNVGEFLAQLDLLGGKGYSPETLALIEFLNDNIRAPRRIAALIDGYLKTLQGVGSPQQGELIARERPTKGAVLETAQKGLPNEPESDVQQSVEPPAKPAQAAGAEARPAEPAAVPGPRKPAAANGIQPASTQSGKRSPRRPAKPVAAGGLPKSAPAAKAVGDAFGAGNKVFTKDKADAARALLRAKLGQVSANAPLDPEIIKAGIDLSGYYIEGGARKFAEYTAKMIGDLGEAVRPYLKSWYMAVKFNPGFDSAGMDSEAEIEAPAATQKPKEPVVRKAAIVPTRAGVMVQPLDDDGNPVGQPHQAGEKAKAEKWPDKTGRPNNPIPFSKIPLTPEQKEVEARFRDWVWSNLDDAVRIYRNGFGDKIKGFGNIINPDDARELSPDYAASNEARSMHSASVHEAVSFLTKEIYQRMLDAPVPKGKKPYVLFSAGGTGSGKTSGIRDVKNLQKLNADANIVYDTNTNNEVSAKKKINAALKAKRNVIVLLTYRDPLDALVNGSLPRAMKRGRTVTLQVHKETHDGAIRTFLHLMEQYAGDERVRFRAVNNSFGKGNQKALPIEKVKDLPHNIGVKELQDALETEYREGRISETVYRATLGGIAEVEHGQSGSDSGSGRDAGVAESETQLPARQPGSPVAGDTAAVKVAGWVSQRLKSKQSFTSVELFKQADAAYGGTQGQGAYTPKDAYDAMELGVNQRIADSGLTITPHGDVKTAREKVEALAAMMKLLPTQSKRTLEQDEWQQFSTPPTYAFVVNWAANITMNDQVLEPSAGIGGIAVFAKETGATVMVNELSERRAALLREMGFDQVFTENAEQLNNVLPEDIKPTVVVMNPPFSATAGRMQGKRDTKQGAAHIEQALKRLEPGGRLVAIVGEGMAAERPAFTKWWNDIKKQYDVRANIGIDGKGYAKYGTTFDNQILVIDKTGPTVNAPITGKVADIVETLLLLEGIRNDRQANAGQDQGAESGAVEPGGEGAAAAPVDQRRASARGKSDAVGDGRSGDIFAQGQRNSGKPAATDTTNDAGRSDEPADQFGGRTDDTAGRPDRREDSSGAPFGDVSTVAPSERPVAGSQLDVQVHHEESNGDNPLTDSVFENYLPQRMRIAGAKPHPAKLVQSAAMASVTPPVPTYKPNLPATIASEGRISMAGLEPVVYAGQAHAQFLPNGDRKGYFIGDGTGVGKGREISGIILDNWNSGRTKAIWISKSAGLINDARRDWRDVGGDGEDIFELGKIKAGDAVKYKKGILFTTYDTLRSQEKKQANDKGEKQGKLRVDQIVEWLGPDFDGVIAFDEAHRMGNAVPMKAKRGVKQVSQQALRGIELQAKLPKARVVYVSATGATEVHNLGYATRLGIWGEGTPFADVKAFINDIESGGLAAMELVSRDLKAMGVYLARSLSYDGVTYSRLEHPLTEVQTEIYNELATAWQGVLRHVDDALDITNQKNNRHAKSAALSAFWGSHQRFFSQIITSMQMPSVIEQVEKDMAAGHAVVMQLVNTNEATQSRQLASMEEDDVLEDLDLTPRENLIQYVRNSFPVQQYEKFLDENGNERARPVVDSKGNPVFNKDAIAERDRIIKTLETIRVPDGPLEMIVNHFGPSKVAEVTGRKQRVVRVIENGAEKTAVQKRGKAAAAADAAAFMADQKRILMFSDAGGTGYSFHADNTKKNRRRRMHYLVQPGWRADNAVQGFGRTHRTNQASEPHYYLITTNLKAQKRFISSIARRLDQLGALTKGERKTGSQGLFSAKDNLESTYAEDAVYQMFHEIVRGRVPGLPFVETMKSLGFAPQAMLDKNGNLNEDKIPDVPKFLNRLLSLTTDMQDKVFDEFAGRLEANVENAIRRGTLDFGMETLRAKGIEVRHEATVRTDEATGAETKYVELQLTHDTIIKPFGEPGSDVQLLKNKTSGKVWQVDSAGTTTTKEGDVVNRFHFDGTGSSHYGELDADKFDKVSRTEARKLWDAENAARPKTYTESVHMLTGSLLPIWDRIRGTIRVARAQTDDGTRVLGRVIHPNNLPEVLKNLGVTSSVSKMPPADVMKAVLADNKIGVLSNGWRLKRSRVSNENRVELDTGRWMQPATVNELTNYGLIIERIEYQERAFVPTADADALTKLLKTRELVDLVRKGEENETALSRATIAGPSMKRDEVNAVVNLFRAKFKGLPTVNVLQSVRQAPGELLRDIRRLGGERDTAGAWHKGEIYVFADNLRGPEHAAWVILHEATHNGLRGMFGRELDTVLMSIYMNNSTVRAAATRQQASRKGLNTIAATEEVLANMGADGVPQSVWDQLIAGIRRILRKLGVTLELTDGDIRALVARALAYNKTPGASTDIVKGTALAAGRDTIDDEPHVGAPFMVYRVASEDQLGNRNAGNAVAIAHFLASAEDFDSPISTKANAIYAYQVTVTEPFGKYEGLHGGRRGQRKEVGKVERGGEISYSFPAGGKWRVEMVASIPLSDAREFLGKNYMAWRFGDLNAGRAASAIRAMFDPGNTALSRTAGGTGTAPVPTRRGAIDALFRIPTQLLGIDKLTSKTYDVLLERLGGLVPEKVKAGVVSNYGIPEAVIDRRVLMGANTRRGFREAQSFIDKVQDLTRAESRIAYEWMTSEHPDETAIEQLPEESRAVLQQMKTLVSSLGKEAVRLNQLSADSYDRNPTSYLHRSYMRYEADQTPQQKAKRARSTRIMGDQYKGRGMTEAVAMSKIQNAAPEWWKRKLQEGKADKGLKGEKFIRLERRANRGDGVAVLPGMEDTGQRGRLLEVLYWPADVKVPDRYGAWDRDEGGVWEARDVKGGQAILWRDFTQDEQDRMGRIDEVRYAVAQTLHKMIHDIEAGRYLEWLANRYAQKNADQKTVVGASERLMDTFKQGEWVKVPESEIPGTHVKAYGKLAGLYLPGPIWNDVRQVVNQRVQPLGETYATMLKAWKISKTALSPAVHMNNVMANVMMADWHDVLATDLAKALSVMVRDTPENRKTLQAFEDAGGKHGLYTLSEIQREQLAPLLEALQKDVNAAGGSGLVNAVSVLQAIVHSGSIGERFRKAVAAAADSKATAAVKKAGGVMLDLYEAEDAVFRLAAYLKAREGGASETAAGKFSRQSFLDYEINAPWVQLMRSTAFPFISFTYRAVPMLLETIAKKPWKLMKLAAVLGGLNALGYLLSGGDEDKERRLLPKEKQGRVLGIVSPKLIRMPWNDKNGNPVFLDIRRFIPVGDILDTEQTHGALPLLPSMMPGGPLAVLGELALNKSMFTGKDIAKPDTDTAREIATKVFDHLFKAFAPNLPYYSFGVLPETYSAKAITDAGTGKTDVFRREQSLPQALLSSVGIKVASYPADVAKRGIVLEYEGNVREIGESIGKLKRELQQKGITREQFDEKVQYQIDKRRKLDDQVRERMR